jgi:hypothetical protein
MKYHGSLHSSTSLFTAVRFAANSGTGVAPSTSENASDELAGTNANSKNQFKSLLDKLTKSVNQTQKLAREAAEMAFEHFQAHGDCVYLQALTDRMAKHAKNFFRADALVSWATTFAPVQCDKGKWTKDKERADAIGWEDNKTISVRMKVDDVDRDVTYKDISFWDFAPIKVAEPLTAEGLLAMLKSKLASKKTQERIGEDKEAQANREALIRLLEGYKLVKIAPAEPASEEGKAAA